MVGDSSRKTIEHKFSEEEAWFEEGKNLDYGKFIPDRGHAIWTKQREAEKREGMMNEVAGIRPNKLYSFNFKMSIEIGINPFKLKLYREDYTSTNTEYDTCISNK